MAYRRLPNTDNARLLAIYKLNEVLSGDDSVISSHQEKVVGFNVTFEKLIEKRETYKTKRRIACKAKDLCITLFTSI